MARPAGRKWRDFTRQKSVGLRARLAKLPPQPAGWFCDIFHGHLLCEVSSPVANECDRGIAILASCCSICATISNLPIYRELPANCSMSRDALRRQFRTFPHCMANCQTNFAIRHNAQIRILHRDCWGDLRRRANRQPRAGDWGRLAFVHRCS